MCIHVFTKLCNFLPEAYTLLLSDETLYFHMIFLPGSMKNSLVIILRTVLSWYNGFIISRELSVYYSMSIVWLGLAAIDTIVDKIIKSVEISGWLWLSAYLVWFYLKDITCWFPQGSILCCLACTTFSVLTKY